jgi:hypothetical protein
MNAELTREPRMWFHDLTELASFCRWMEDTGRAPRDRWEMVELAHRYGPEHDEFVREEELERMADEEDAFIREGRYS